MAIETCREGVQGQAHGKDQRRLSLKVGKHCFTVNLWSSCNQRHSKVTWTQSWAPGPGGPEQGEGLDKETSTKIPFQPQPVLLITWSLQFPQH